MAKDATHKESDKPAKLVNITNAVGDNEILLYGYVGRYEAIDWVPFQNVFRQMESKVGSGNITLRFNCYGGDMLSGLSIYDLVRNSKANVIGINEGIAASMGGLLLLGCDERRGTKNSRIMIHPVQAMARGEAEDLRTVADNVDAENKKVINIIMERTGCDDKTAKQWCAYGKETWFDLKKAIECKLIDQEEKSPKAQFDNSFDPANEESIKGYFTNSLKNSFSKPYQMKNLIVLLGSLNIATLTNAFAGKDEPTEQEVFDAFKNALNDKDQKITELQNKLQKQADDQAEATVNAAIQEGKIKATDKEQSLKDAKANPEMFARMLSNIPGKTNVTNNMTRGSSEEQPKNGEAKNAGRDSWTYRDYETKDRAALENMEKSEPDKFKKLFKDYYGHEYEA
jgi:ATP-dependent protease ClpP protease subunit